MRSALLTSSLLAVTLTSNQHLIFPCASNCEIQRPHVYVGGIDMSRILASPVPIYVVDVSSSGQLFAFQADFHQTHCDLMNKDRVILANDVTGFVPLHVTFKGIVTKNNMENPFPIGSLDSIQIKLSKSNFDLIQAEISSLLFYADSKENVLVSSLMLYRGADDTNSSLNIRDVPNTLRRVNIQLHTYPDHLYASIVGEGETEFSIDVNDVLVASPQLLSEIRNSVVSEFMPNVVANLVTEYADLGINQNTVLAFLKSREVARLQRVEAERMQRRFEEPRAQPSSSLWGSFVGSLKDLLDSINN